MSCRVDREKTQQNTVMTIQGDSRLRLRIWGQREADKGL